MTVLSREQLAKLAERRDAMVAHGWVESRPGLYILAADTPKPPPSTENVLSLITKFSPNKTIAAQVISDFADSKKHAEKSSVS